MKKGKLIVIDGTDGTGKATQTALLVERLKKLGHDVAVEDFPQYGKKSAGLVEEYLTGAYNHIKHIGPQVPSIFYAVDRFAASSRIQENLEKGKLVISNRYVTASMGHQGGKIKSASARKKFYTWLFDLEFNIFKIPKPDLNVILHLPAAVAQKLVDEKGHRNYLGAAKRDILEADIKHLRNAEKNYLEISKKFKYPLVECYEKGKILSREEISELIWKKVSKVLK